MNFQSLNLENSSVLSEEELMLLLGGGIDHNEPITRPGDNLEKCNNCDKCDKCICSEYLSYVVYEHLLVKNEFRAFKLDRMLFLWLCYPV